MPNPDILVILAEFFLRVIEITWSIVGGVYENRLIVIFRNDGIRKNAGNLAARAFGKLGSAGGHVSSARAEIPLDHLPDLPDPEQSTAWESLPHQPDRRTGEIESFALLPSSVQPPGQHHPPDPLVIQDNLRRRICPRLLQKLLTASA